MINLALLSEADQLAPLSMVTELHCLKCSEIRFNCCLCDSRLFLNISTRLKILNAIKTMEGRLCALTLLHTHGNISVHEDDAVDRFARHQRKLQFL